MDSEDGFYDQQFTTNLENEPQQLIMFDKKIRKETVEKNKHLTARKPNINIIFIDTMSRAEFYMGMPRTTELLKNISKDREVFDYKLFQSISHQTYNHLQNFFNGPYPTMPIVRNMSYMRMGEKFFKSAKDAGYMTSYSRDMCYAYDWTYVDKPSYSQRWESRGQIDRSQQFSCILH